MPPTLTPEQVERWEELFDNAKTIGLSDLKAVHQVWLGLCEDFPELTANKRRVYVTFFCDYPDKDEGVVVEPLIRDGGLNQRMHRAARREMKKIGIGEGSYAVFSPMRLVRIAELKRSGARRRGRRLALSCPPSRARKERRFTGLFIVRATPLRQGTSTRTAANRSHFF